MKQLVRLQCLMLSAIVSAFVVGCSKNVAGESVVVKNPAQPAYPEHLDFQAVSTQSPHVVSPGNPAIVEATEHDPRTSAATVQTDHTGLSRSLPSNSITEPSRGATHPERTPLRQQVNSTESPQGLAGGAQKMETQEESPEATPQTQVAEVVDPWHDLLQAPATQSDPIIPIEPLDLQMQREVLDALVLPEGDPRAALIGCWRQSDGPTTPDFGNGGYTQSFLVFRTDGFVDLIRLYGTDGTIRLIKRYDYLISNEGVMTLGKSEKYRPQFQPRTQRLPDQQGTTIVITPPALALPCQVKYKASKKTIELQGKKYERVKPQEPAEHEQSDH